MDPNPEGLADTAVLTKKKKKLMEMNVEADLLARHTSVTREK